MNEESYTISNESYKSMESLPKFFVLSFSELLEIPFWINLFWVMNNCSFLANEAKLNSVNWLANSDINDRETSFNDFLALFVSFVGVPFISNQGGTKMFWESNCNIIILNVAAIHVNSCQERLSIFESCNDEIVVVGIGVVSFFITDSTQVVCVILDCEMNIVVEGFGFSCKFVHFSGGFLEVCVFASCSQDNAFSEFFDSIDIRIFWNDKDNYLRALRMPKAYH